MGARLLRKYNYIIPSLSLPNVGLSHGVSRKAFLPIQPVELVDYGKTNLFLL